MNYNMDSSLNMTLFDEIALLISEKKLTKAENMLNAINEKSAHWHFLYSKLLFSKSWFDSANEHLNLSISMDPTNSQYRGEQLTLMARYRRYSDDYYDSGYRRNRGCSCCCCDCCCCDCDVSCCDLICLDQCCECFGGDFISCI